MSFLNRMFSLVWNESEQQDQSVAITEPVSIHDNVAATLRIAELEQHIEHQNRQIARARSLLQNAAFLAGYHQPSLERDIRILLTEIETKDVRTGTTSPRAGASRSWTLPPSGSKTVSA
jgi:hypothetical protein